MVIRIKIIILTIIILSLYRCSYFAPDKVRQDIEANFGDVELEMDSGYSKAKKAFNIKYERLLQAKIDSIDKKNIIFFYNQTLGTLNYIDSLKLEINKLDDEDFKNISVIKKMFVTDGIGDTVFSKLKLSYELAESISISPKTKSTINKSKVNMLQETNLADYYFGLDGPKAALMTLYAFEKELLKVAGLATDGRIPNSADTK